jgi:predicted phage-related endonuclease
MAVNTKIADRRYVIGGSDARIIMGDDETALIRLWREKRGEVEPERRTCRPIWRYNLGLPPKT